MRKKWHDYRLHLPGLPASLHAGAHNKDTLAGLLRLTGVTYESHPLLKKYDEHYRSDPTSSGPPIPSQLQKEERRSPTVHPQRDAGAAKANEDPQRERRGPLAQTESASSRSQSPSQTPGPQPSEAASGSLTARHSEDKTLGVNISPTSPALPEEDADQEEQADEGAGAPVSQGADAGADGATGTGARDPGPGTSLDGTGHEVVQPALPDPWPPRPEARLGIDVGGVLNKFDRWT